MKHPCPFPYFLSMDLVVLSWSYSIANHFNFLAPPPPVCFVLFTWQNLTLIKSNLATNFVVPQSWTWGEENGDNLVYWSHFKHIISISSAYLILPTYLQCLFWIPVFQTFSSFLKSPINHLPFFLYLILSDLAFIEKMKDSTGQFSFYH